MTLYAMIGYDRPDAVARRDEIRAEHRAYVRANQEKIRLAGAFTNEQDEQIGSLIVFEADNPEEVWDWIRQEPFYSDGIYETVHVKRWGVAIGAIA